MERQALITKVKILMRLNEIKQKRYQEEHNNPELGCLTRESFQLLALIPKMASLGIKWEDCQ